MRTICDSQWLALHDSHEHMASPFRLERRIITAISETQHKKNNRHQLFFVITFCIIYIRRQPRSDEKL
jgi:hypothetical protein